jgi:hypothetical protein
MSYILWIGATVTAFLLGALWVGVLGFSLTDPPDR